jgi:integrase-like protein
LSDEPVSSRSRNSCPPGRNALRPLLPKARAAVPGPGGSGLEVPVRHRRARCRLQPIKHFRRAWLTARKAAKAPHRIPHDFRRTAVRNLERAGVPRSAAMKMVGHKTEAIYRRYAIADESMLREGAAKLEVLLQAQRGALRVVVPLRTGKVTAKSPGFDMRLEGVSIAEVTETMERRMVGRDEIEPPTPGFSVLILNRVHRQHSQRLARSSASNRRRAKWLQIARCYAA